jgi:hypothetical protein
MSGTILAFPTDRMLGAMAHDARVQWVFWAIDGKPNPIKKQLIVWSAAVEVGLLSRQEATALLRGLGLSPA